MAAETVIESFCERCGTRYTFEPVRKRESRLVGLGKQLGILLEDHAATLAQRDPFHGTFHFCLDCRQYTCPRCWNEAAGFCLGCMPLPDQPDSMALAAAEAEAGMEAASWMDQVAVEQAALADPSAWPDADLHRGHPAGSEPAWPAAELAAPDAEPAAESEPEPLEEPADSWSLTFEPEPATVAAVDAIEEAEPELDLDRLAAVTGLAILPELFDDAPTPRASGPERDADAPLDPAAIIVLGAGTLASDGGADLDAEAAPGAVVEAEPATEAAVEIDLEAVAGAEVEAEAVAEAVAEAGLEADADVEADPEAGLVAEVEAVTSAEAVADAEPVADPETVAGAEVDVEAVLAAELVDVEAEVETVADAEFESQAELESELATFVEPQAELVAEAELEAGAEVVAEAEPVAEAEATTASAVDVGATTLVAVAALAAVAPDDEAEADWADLFRRLPDPTDDEPADEWATLTPWLGPDVAPIEPPAAPDPQPASPPPAAPTPVPAPAQPAVAWQVTAPSNEADARPAQWPPLGPVFRPQPVAPQPAPHPSVLARRPAQGGLLARGHVTPAGAQPVSSGVRPCINCELPLSANARFCRRCGRPQG